MGEPEPLSLQASTQVDADATTAFRAFTERIDEWWVREFTWSGPSCLASIGIEPRLGGAAYEIGPYGFRLDWGRVVAWEPPHRLVLTWHIAPDRVPQPDPAHASEVEVHFHPKDGGTVIELEHRNFERHGQAGAAYRQNMTIGWRELLGRLAVVCAANTDTSNPSRRAAHPH